MSRLGPLATGTSPSMLSWRNPAHSAPPRPMAPAPPRPVPRRTQSAARAHTASKDVCTARCVSAAFPSIKDAAEPKKSPMLGPGGGAGLGGGGGGGARAEGGAGAGVVVNGSLKDAGAGLGFFFAGNDGLAVALAVGGCRIIPNSPAAGDGVGDGGGGAGAAFWGGPLKSPAKRGGAGAGGGGATAFGRLTVGDGPNKLKGDPCGTLAGVALALFWAGAGFFAIGALLGAWKRLNAGGAGLGAFGGGAGGRGAKSPARPPPGADLAAGERTGRFTAAARFPGGRCMSFGLGGDTRAGGGGGGANRLPGAAGCSPFCVRLRANSLLDVRGPKLPLNCRMTVTPGAAHACLRTAKLVGGPGLG